MKLAATVKIPATKETQTDPQVNLARARRLPR
jgi:hypothetical protein